MTSFPFGLVSFEYLAYEAFEMLKEAGGVAEQALEKIDEGTYDGAAWSKSMTDLVGISLSRYSDCAEKMLGEVDEGPALSTEMFVESDENDIRRIEVVSMARANEPDAKIPSHLISVDPPVLGIGASRCVISVSDPSYSGYSYDVVAYLHSLGVNPSKPDGETATDTVAL